MMKQMIRIDGAIAGEEGRIRDILDEAEVCRLGLLDSDGVYILPLSYGYTVSGGTLRLFFHGNGNGRKGRILSDGLAIYFEIDTHTAIKSHSEACMWSASYRSVMGKGIVRMLTDTEDREDALDSIMLHYSGKKDWSYDRRNVSSAMFFSVEVTELSLKEHF